MANFGYNPKQETWNPKSSETYEEFIARTGRGAGSGGPAVAATTGDGVQPNIADAGNGNLQLASQDDAGDPTLQAVNQLIDLAKGRDADSLAAIEEFIGTSIPKLQALADKANAGDMQALKALESRYDQFTQLAPPEMVAAAQTNQGDIDRQLDAYGMQGDVAQRYKALSGQEMTAQERYLLELNRREEEGSMRAMREGSLRDLDARGARSGGAEMAAILGAQQTTSQNRSLQDLGAQAQVNDRAFQGLQGYGNTTAQMSQTAGNIRDAGDVMSRFNQQQAQQWAQYEGDYKAQQQNDATDRAKNIYDATTYTTNKAYGRGFDQYGAERDATAMKTGQYSAGGSAIADAISSGIGVDEARRAEAALNKKPKWKIGDPILLDKIL